MQQSFSFFPRWKALATVLSVLALFSTLLAPAAALAQDLGQGQWFGVCWATHGGQPQHDDPDDDHCGLCLLPGAALLTAAAPDWPAGRAVTAPPSGPAPGWRAEAQSGPFIRGPPTQR